jgi:predicted ATPase/DNA-binding XRE family transcriptional regulator
VRSSTSRRSFGALLKEQRLAAGLTQAALGERAGIAERTIQDLERGITLPRRETVRRLSAALGLAPAEQADFESVSPAPRRRADPATSSTADLEPASYRPSALPISPTDLLGREHELAEIRALLHAGARLVTLTGPGGVGKTRLAIQIAALLAAGAAPACQHGVVMVELASITDPTLVPGAIAKMLGVHDSNGRLPLEIVQAHLRDRHLLLVLDNVEQVLPAASTIAALLAACPGLTVLATSREPLRIRGEREYQVRPLAVPDARQLERSAGLAEHAAIALFVERARAIQADFALTPETLSTIAAICARLEGLPLAIELAAARTRLLSPSAILGRLEHRLPVLTGGSRDLPARQQTLRDAIAWSYGLLSEGECRLLRRLAVFGGGWSLEAAETVAGDGSWVMGHRGSETQSLSPNTQHPTPNTLDVLELLAAKSLIRRCDDVAGEPRFDMLETIREYAQERLEESGEAQVVRRRHADYFVTLAERSRLGLRSAVRPSWLGRLKAEHDNFHVVLRWIVEQDEPGLALRFSRALAHFWDSPGYHTEGQTFMDAAFRPPAADVKPPGAPARTEEWRRSPPGDVDRAPRRLHGDADGSVGMAVLAGSRAVAAGW